MVRFNWYKADANCIKEYGNVSQQFLNKVSIPKEAMHCSTLYADICTALLKASTGCIENDRGSNNGHMVVSLTCMQKPAMLMYYGATLVIDWARFPIICLEKFQ